eukprot:1852451-Pleurochrysis_carterae.AAC.1
MDRGTWCRCIGVSTRQRSADAKNERLRKAQSGERQNGGRHDAADQSGRRKAAERRHETCKG